MKKEELIKQLESTKRPEIKVGYHQQRLKMALLTQGYSKKQKNGKLLETVTVITGDVLGLIIGGMRVHRAVWRVAVTTAGGMVVLFATLMLIPQTSVIFSRVFPSSRTVVQVIDLLPSGGQISSDGILTPVQSINNTLNSTAFVNPVINGPVTFNNSLCVTVQQSSPGIYKGCILGTITNVSGRILSISKNGDTIIVFIAPNATVRQAFNWLEPTVAPNGKTQNATVEVVKGYFEDIKTGDNVTMNIIGEVGKPLQVTSVIKYSPLHPPWAE